MKKILLIMFAVLLVFHGGMSYAADESTSIFSSLKNAIIKDVQQTVNSTVTTAANKAINLVKINQYKQQIAQKEQEIADLEASNTFFIAKFFKKRKLNREIRELENKIKELES